MPAPYGVSRHANKLMAFVDLAFEQDPSFQKLKRTYVETLVDTIRRLHAILDELAEQPERIELLHTLHTYSHQIVGSAGSYGLLGVSAAAKVLESELRVQIDKELPSVFPGAIVNIRQFITDLEEVATNETEELTEEVSIQGRRAEDRPVVVVGKELSDLAENLKNEGYNILHFDSADDFVSQSDFITPSCIIHRTDAVVSTGEPLRVKIQLNERLREVPYLAVIREDSIDSRLHALRLGAGGIFPEPVSPSDLYPYLVPTGSRLRYEEPTQIVVIDDDESLLQLIDHVLRPLNCSVMCCHTAEEAFAAFKRATPDIILLDTLLEDRDGFEIYRVLKLDSRLSAASIILMVTEGDELERVSDFNLGEDTYIVKPFHIKELRSRIRREIIRVRSLRRLATVDSLSGLNNRAYFEELLRRELLRAQRYQTTFSVVMLDIDNFAELNKKLGADACDNLIRDIGGTLREAVRSSDLVARIGGDEFGLLLLGVDLENAKRLVERLRLVIADLPVSEQISLSAAIFSFPKHYKAGIDIFSQVYKRLKSATKNKETTIICG